MNTIFPVRSGIPFGTMTTMECFVVLVEGQMPDGTVIDLETRKNSLAKLIPMVLNWELYTNPGIIEDMIRKPNDPCTLRYKAEKAEFDSLVQRAKAILTA